MTKREKIGLLKMLNALKERDLRYVLGYATACIERDKPKDTKTA